MPNPVPTTAAPIAIATVTHVGRPSCKTTGGRVRHLQSSPRHARSESMIVFIRSTSPRVRHQLAPQGHGGHVTFSSSAEKVGGGIAIDPLS